MAGKAKPNIPNLKEEGKIKFFEYNDRHGYFDGPETLLDENLNWIKHDYGCCLLLRDDNSIDFEISQKSNIWAYGIYVSDSGGSTPKPVNLYKKINGEFVLFKQNIQTYNDKWYLLFNKLDKGIYRVKNIKDYANFTEWYVENLDTNRYIIKDNNKYYCIDNNYYVIDQNENLNNSDVYKLCKKYGIKDINIINESSFIKFFLMTKTNKIYKTNIPINFNEIISDISINDKFTIFFNSKEYKIIDKINNIFEILFYKKSDKK